MRALTSQPIRVFDEKALTELKKLARGGSLYVLAPSHEWEMLTKRWGGNWLMLGSVSLPLESPSAASSFESLPAGAAMQHPLDPGKFYDLQLNHESVDLMQVRLW